MASRFRHPVHRWLSVAVLLGAATGAAASPASRFVEASLPIGTDSRDSLAAGFDTRQLPLITAALVADPPADVDPDALYTALTRWHYYAGKHFDPERTGLWTTGYSTDELAAPGGLTLSDGAALELVELTSLARLAHRRGHVFDAMVWWYDQLQLGQRLTRRLYDPASGAYVDLDSLGRKSNEPRLSGLIPIALSARHGGELTRLAAWKLWTGEAERGDPADLDLQSRARRRSEAFESWSTDHGLHLISPATMAALSLAALDDLDEPTLAVLARDALASRGIAPSDSIRLHLGTWEIRTTTAEYALRPLERSAAVIEYLAAVGAFPQTRADSLRTLVGEARTEEEVSAATSELTNLLVQLRGMEVRDKSHQWTSRRAGRDDLDPGERAAFDFQWADLPIWIDRACDLLAADILGWHLRPDHDSTWNARLDPPVVGQGDTTKLVVSPRSLAADGGLDGRSLTMMWTDGVRLLPPAEAPAHSAPGLGFEVAVPDLPSTTGLYHLIVEGLPTRPRIAAALSIVEPVLVDIRPVERRGGTVDWAVFLRSQVKRPVAGRVDIDAPITWTSSPGTSLHYQLEPGDSTELKFAVTPDGEVAPGSYPLGWSVWTDSRRVGNYETAIDRPFSWLRVGPLPITNENNPLASDYSFDRSIDLARRIPGVGGTTAWTRLPAGRVDPEGYVLVSTAEDPDGLHYAFTGFVTQSRDAIMEFDSAGPAHVYVNGRRVIAMDRWGGRREQDVQFGPGTNYVVVKLLDESGSGARFRLRIRDIDGGMLRGVGNELSQLVENFAYLARARRSQGSTEELHTLRLVPIQFDDPDAHAVSVVGSFNGWSPAATPMVRGEDGRWQVKIRMRPGRFEYKFAVDGTEWVPDPSNPEAVDDGFGGRNSVLVVD
jgi:hypothetical protein